ncbi:MAG: isovaleryl-CoA dehydrogenase, partial [Deltaproteobacteria bacterium]|nr:isovaleryl-CoA dehydrogenase [Deltaproteobacteria bacterium]
MNFELTSEIEAIRDTARKFAQKGIMPLVAQD